MGLSLPRARPSTFGRPARDDLSLAEHLSSYLVYRYDIVRYYDILNRSPGPGPRASRLGNSVVLF